MNRLVILGLVFVALAAAPLTARAEELADSDTIAKHLEFFGYKVVAKDGDLQAEHPQNANFSVKPLRGGTLFLTYFPTEDATRSAAGRKDTLELVNDFNQNSVLVNFFIDKDGDLGASAWFPGRYEKATFGALVERWNSDIQEAFQRDPERTRALLR
jgi:Putative bacterial sensory transduction regulator